MFNIFSILPIAFVSTSLRFKDMKLTNNVRHQAFPIKAVSDPNQKSPKSNIDYKLYASRRMMQLKNMYSPKTYPPCAYCDGTGFVECPKCNHGCWHCEQTTLVKCHHCGGGGESVPCFHFFPIYSKDMLKKKLHTRNPSTNGFGSAKTSEPTNLLGGFDV